MNSTNNLHVTHTMPLTTPHELKQAYALSPQGEANITRHRQTIRNCISGADKRPLIIVGPCSIHDPTAARDYAAQLQRIATAVADELVIVMRVYFEKPRTTVGWKGLISDPHLDGSHDMETGLRLARSLLVDLAEADMPTATEFLDPISPQYLADCVSWTAIGARTTESQTHRQMASGLSMPVGFKNGTDGGLTVAINALVSCAASHRFLGVDDDGRVAMVQTEGNPDGHVVLRGGGAGPNYHREAVLAAVDQLQAAGVCSRLLVDCSHGNSSKDHRRQAVVLADLADQWLAGNTSILGAMLESNIEAGRQDFGPNAIYGQSITDACIDVAETETILKQLAQRLTERVNVANS